MKTELNQKNQKHLRVYDQLFQGILRGEYDPGTRLPSDSELAEKFSVSRPTIAKAIQILEKKGLVDRRAGAGSVIRTPNPAKDMKMGLLMTRLQVTPRDFGEFVSLCSTMISQISLSASDHNHVLLMNELPFGDAEELISHAWQICQNLIELQVKGVFFMPLEVSEQHFDINRRIAEALDEAGITVTLIDRDVYSPPRRSKFDIVSVNNELAAFEITSHLIAAGCRRINFVAGKHPVSSVMDRIQGYEQALRYHGLTPEAERVRRFEILPFMETSEKTERAAVKHLLEETNAEALVCVNDRTAAIVMKYATENGVRIPDDLGIVGFDDEAFCAYLPISLTTMRHPARAVGGEAVRAMLSRMETPDMPARTILLSAELVVRESCGSRNALTSPA